MNKKELARLYKEMAIDIISINKAEKEIDTFIKTLTDALLVDEKVKFTRIGVFEILIRQPRVIANPVTREPMKIYPKKTVRFRVSKRLSIIRGE